MFTNRNGEWRIGWCVLAGAAVIAAIVGLILALIYGITVTLGVHYGKVNCNKFAEASNYQTKFVRNSAWSWDCYANVNGHWLPIGQVRGNH